MQHVSTPKKQYRPYLSTTSTTSSSSASASPPPDHCTFQRTSVSIQVDEDPFAPCHKWQKMVVEEGGQRGEEIQVQGLHTAGGRGGEEEEDWMRISEDSFGPALVDGLQEKAESEVAVTSLGGVKTIRKSPSFLMTIWNKRLTATPDSSSPFRSLKSKISNPTLKTTRRAVHLTQNSGSSKFRSDDMSPSSPQAFDQVDVEEKEKNNHHFSRKRLDQDAQQQLSHPAPTMHSRASHITASRKVKTPVAFHHSPDLKHPIDPSACLTKRG